ncbi:DUF4176 domain-containing protein [uncultured Allobaculum sp.]|uniref:DUF4176 domain-containing protein n=1 Tax=uncultured Allobaculum sp. TaxID=1187017 RepID=UPI00258E93A7|nr:DUF4176 domain-containing protein [uncultured Allobaculum sp.]
MEKEESKPQDRTDTSKSENLSSPGLKPFLPLGSIVCLKEGDKRFMIIGRAQHDVTTGRLYDYAAVGWPEGLISARQTCMFNAPAIQSLVFIGLQDEEEIQFRRQMDQKWAEHLKNSASTAAC